MSTIKSLAGTGCTCGVQCRCPGCTEHRTPQNVTKYRNDCGDSCGTCVGHSLGIVLPIPQSSSSGRSNRPSLSIIDQFFARAAALPRPQHNLKMGIHLNPVDVNVSRTTSAKVPERRQELVSFRSINLHKLKCCSGRCQCSGGLCGCGEHCDGDCAGQSHADLDPLIGRRALHS